MSAKVLALRACVAAARARPERFRLARIGVHRAGGGNAGPRSQDRGRHGAELMARKLIAFDDDTFGKLTQLGRDRMATLQELADEAFADLLRKHGIPIDLKDALRKSARRLNMLSDHVPSDLATSRGAKKQNRKAK